MKILFSGLGDLDLDSGVTVENAVLVLWLNPPSMLGRLNDLSQNVLQNWDGYIILVCYLHYPKMHIHESSCTYNSSVF